MKSISVYFNMKYDESTYTHIQTHLCMSINMTNFLHLPINNKGKNNNNYEAQKLHDKKKAESDVARPPFSFRSYTYVCVCVSARRCFHI